MKEMDGKEGKVWELERERGEPKPEASLGPFQPAHG